MQLTSAVLSLLLCFTLLVGGCSQPKPLKIGFAGGLTGRLADLGTGGRDGALLATEDLNAAEAIGRELETGTVFVNRCDYLDPALTWTGVKDTGRGAALSPLGFHGRTRPKSWYVRRAPA